MKTDVIIPVYGPDDRFFNLIKLLASQTVRPDRYIIMNTGEELWDKWITSLGGEVSVLPENMDIVHLTKEDFDHGATRDAAIRRSDADVCVLMTQDALPANEHLIENLIKGLKVREGTAVAYARQLPDDDCGLIERYTRSFNYPEEPLYKSKEDLPKLGIKTYMCSDVCAAYDREIYLRVGGFIKKTIFNEDMIYAAYAMDAGYGVYYAADAEVYHTHEYTAMQQFHRNFDLAVSQADHPEVFANVKSESEGVRLVRNTAVYLIKSGHTMMIAKLVWQSGFKYLGYLLGKQYRRLPKFVINFCTMSPNYWNRPEE